MNTKQSTPNSSRVRDCPTINVRLPKETYEIIKELSKRERRGIGPQCAVFIDRQLALEKANKSEE